MDRKRLKRNLTLLTASSFMVTILGISLTMPARADEPVSVPFEDMTDAEWNEFQRNQAAYAEAVRAWGAYDQAVMGANAEHEARLYSWREHFEAWNMDPSLPSPGPRPELIMPQPPSMPRP